MKKVIFTVVALLSLQSIFAQVQTCTEAQRNPAAAKTSYRGDLSGDGRMETVFLCTENNRLYFRMSPMGRKIAFSKEIEIADPDFFTTKDYSISLSDSKAVTGATFRIFEVKAAADAGSNVMIHAAYPMMRNETLSGIIYGYSAKTTLQDFIMGENKPGTVVQKNYLMEKNMKPGFENLPVQGNFAVISVYENVTERTPVEMTVFDAQTKKTLRLVNAFPDETKRLQRVFVWDNINLKQMYSR